LKENKEINNIEKLYEDIITLYEKKNFLITFVWAKQSFMQKITWYFYNIRKEENTDRDKALESNLNTFIEIYENSSDIIQKNGYDTIKFYGVLFCYFNY